jgi:hypothetical protein
MATAIPGGLSEEEVNAIIDRSKAMTGDLEWNERPNESLILVAGSNLLDEVGATIPGLTVELFYRRTVVRGEYRYLFTMFQLKGNKKLRAYQIEVVPPEKQSHVEDGEIWFGPHQHFGERAAKFLNGEAVYGNDHEAWFHTFLAVAKIQFPGKYYPPEPPDLFS